MSGHNKWSTIKHKKGKADAKRGKIFTKLARYITVAAREGGGDAEYNNALKNAVEKAKAENMPNDNIERAIKKGTGDLEGISYEEITYEGYGPGGIAVLVECLTDNKNRTVADVKHYFSKCGGNLGTSGSVSFMFEHKGILIIDKEKFPECDEDELMMLAIDAGADDLQIEEDYFEITSEMSSFGAVREALKAEGFTFEKAEIAYIPQNYQELPEEHHKNMLKLIDMMEDHDDIQEMYHNWDIPDDLEI